MRRDKDEETGDGEGHATCADKAAVAVPSPSPTIIEDIRMAHRERCFFMEQRKRADLAIGSFLRTAFGWRKDGDPDVNDRAKEKAAALMEIGEADTVVQRLLAKCNGNVDDLKGHDRPALKRARAKIAVDEPDYFRWRRPILVSIAGRAAYDTVEEAATKRMRDLARKLPVFGWWQEHVFEEPLQLAVIVGEAGNLSNYPPDGSRLRRGPSCLWKRMGVAVIGAGDGVKDKRQGGLSKSASADDWIEHAYSRKRRSRLFVIGDTLKKQQGSYRDIYLKRLVDEHRRAVDKGLIPATTTKDTVESWEKRGLPPLTKVTKLGPQHMGAGHMERRAQRYMEKRVLKDLWRAWRRAEQSVAERPNAPVPAAAE